MLWSVYFNVNIESSTVNENTSCLIVWTQNTLLCWHKKDKRKSRDGVKMPSCHVPTVNDTTVDILVVIISAPQHFNKRKYLRRTWARRGRFFLPSGSGWGNPIRNLSKRIWQRKQYTSGRLDVTDTYAALPVKVCSLHWTIKFLFYVSVFFHCHSSFWWKWLMMFYLI